MQAAWAGPPTEQLRSAIDKVIGIVVDRQLAKAECDAAVQKIADRIFDFRETTKRTLGLHWRNRSSQERREFERLFRKLLEQAYISKVEAYRREKVVYGESQDGDDAIVRTRLIGKRGNDVPIDYFMLKQGDRWLIPLARQLKMRARRRRRGCWLADGRCSYTVEGKTPGGEVTGRWPLSAGAA